MLLVLALALTSAGCAAAAGWERTERRACTPEEPPRLCVTATPDRAATVRAGGEAVVPGECMLSPRRRGGSLRVEALDGRTGARRGRWVGVRRGATTRVAIDGAGAPRRVGRERCDGQVDQDMGEGTGSGGQGASAR